jgi:hypothetical protein
MSAVFASADQIARGVVAAARLVGADPLRIYEPSPRAPNAMSRARWLAYAALSSIVEGCGKAALARSLGIGSAWNAPSNFKLAKNSKWWREDWVDEIVGAILAPESEPELGGAVEVLPEPSAPSPPPAPPRKPGRRAPLDLGEPEPGRSALDRRRSGVSDPEEEDARRRSARASVSLPRLKFLEKGAE